MIEPVSVAATGSRLALLYQAIRQQTEVLIAPLTPEDCVIQSMPDCSPVRWHLAHTTWFFETFVLKAVIPNYKPFDTSYEYLFNSYYNTIGKQYPREKRGLLSRPSLHEIQQYRKQIDAFMLEWLESKSQPSADQLSVVEIGLQHEQQHQELILTDVKHPLSCNPLFPAYQNHHRPADQSSIQPLEWIPGREGVVPVGHTGNGFGYDNEFPRHKTYLQPHALASRLITNGEYLEFIEDGGYQRPEFWLSLGWASVTSQNWRAPLYWIEQGEGWQQFTLTGLRPLQPNEPVCHVSYFEADAFARWAGKRLPTEFEWESGAADHAESLGLSEAGEDTPQLPGNFVEQQNWHPQPASNETGFQQLWGDLWEWTSSSYAPYPGYRAPAGAIGEYNGKFMCNQYVLRGGSCATPQSHLRSTYRNFFGPACRWQLTGIRLAD